MHSVTTILIITLSVFSKKVRRTNSKKTMIFKEQGLTTEMIDYEKRHNTLQEVHQAPVQTEYQQTSLVYQPTGISKN
ncbi:unnamed protein product [Sphenostylis stenocarpa]|uniref:Uncharacterized protein n=1 Tax=Sphenostylis stenocarpa TaxID=92480 RepID=A0AA86VGU1_9FABA|nr:unnamed protein product [Sphenostylis stenocarpa]